MKKIFVLQSQYSKRIITASKSILKIKKYILEQWFVSPEEKQKFLEQEKNYKMVIIDHSSHYEKHG